MELWSEWWVWMSAALALATLEVLVPGYIFLGFAIGAFILGLGQLIGLTGLGLPLTLVIFAALSLIAFLLLRRYFRLKSGQVKVWDRDIND